MLETQTTPNNKPRSYNGMVTPAFYCTECDNCTQLTSANTPPRYCAHCASPNLINEVEYTKRLFAHSVRVPREAFDYLYTSFQSQHAYNDFREYVNVMVHNATPIDPHAPKVRTM